MERGQAERKDTPDRIFVGRERELADLWTELEEALAWKGRACFVVGQAGSGKTALVRHFLHQALAAEPKLVVATGSCNAQTGTGDPFLPFREALAMLTDQDAAQRAAGKVSAENSHRLQTVVVRSIQVLVEAAPHLVGAFVPGGALVGALGRALVNKVGWMAQLDDLAEKKAEAAGAAEAMADQARIFEQYTAFVQRLSKTMPLILFFDDLQWADNASLNLLFHLGRHLENYPVLILGAYRPDDVALGRDGKRHPLEPVVNELTRYYGDISVDLDAIPEERGRQFIAALLETESHCLGETFRQALFERTNGHALFTVELLQAMKEHGDLVVNSDGCWVEGNALDWDALPARVEGVIEERIARLDDELREILTVGSIEGEEFRAEVVAQVRNLAELEMLRRLSDELERKHRLVSALGMVQYGKQRLSLYRFWHNLFQQYLYDSLDEVERAYLHQDVGEVLEALFEGQTESVAAQLARHFEEAGVASKAAAYRLQAGRSAHRMSAHQEAEAHLTRGLELVRQLSAGADALQLELGLQTALGTTQIATHGYASPQVEQAYGCARELCRSLGDPPQVIPVLYGLCLFRMVRGELQTAHEEGQRLLMLAQEAGDNAYILGCHVQLGVSAFYMGRFSDSRRYLEEAAAQYDPSHHADLAYRHGQDPGVTALSYLSWQLWIEGYPDQARARSAEALSLAVQLKHPYSLGLATAIAAKLHELLREWPECQSQAEAALQLADVGRFSIWQAMATMLRGTAMAHQGRPDEGIAELRKGLADLEATGTNLAAPYFRARLAETYLLMGKREEGLQAVDESLRQVEQAWWQPEQHRIRAELLRLAPNAEAEAESALRQALAVAKSQNSKMLELRATTSLARLLSEQGRTTEARDVLLDCYAGFSEGRETADLRDARDSLDAFQKELAGAGQLVMAGR
jgi:predicted ATPase